MNRNDYKQLNTLSQCISVMWWMEFPFVIIPDGCLEYIVRFFENLALKPEAL